MNLPFYIARRYLFSKKSHNAINLISGISVCGVALATIALVCTLSVFNGFQDMVATLFTAFDPELKITSVEGKVFSPLSAEFHQVKELPEVEIFMEALEENVMVQYKERQMMAVVKGVENNFEQLTNFGDILYGQGDFLLKDEVVDYGIMGIELVSLLGTGIKFVEPLEVYAPKRGRQINVSNPSSSFTRQHLFSPGVVFAVEQQKYDAGYIVTSLNFARNLFGYENEVSSIEIKISSKANLKATQKKIQEIIGEDYKVQNRYEQQEDIFRIMEVEKLVAYIFLTFILMIACFNVIGSLSMLIIDKKEDIETLRNLGADNKLIARIFLFEGCMISICGALLGALLGVIICLLQQYFGIIKLGNTAGRFIIDAYPVSVHVIDIVIILITVTVVGFLSVWYPVRYLNKRLLVK